MPLHLLGKKSWNVYNKANIETVRRDEAKAKAAEEAEEERIQAIDAKRRLQILRGETPLPITDPNTQSTTITYGDTRNHSSQQSSTRSSKNTDKDHKFGEKKIRKKYGENDTDYEIRVARAKVDETTKQTTYLLEDDDDDDRFRSSREKKREREEGTRKNKEAEREAEEKRREYEDQYTMRFANAAGYKQNPADVPWYSMGDGDRIKGSRDQLPYQKTSIKNVWGQEDPKKLYREAERIRSNDPLAIMKVGASKVRAVEREKRRLREREELERESERELRKEQKKRKHRRDHDEDVEVLSLDISCDRHKKHRKRHRMKTHHEKDNS